MNESVCCSHILFDDANDLGNDAVWGNSEVKTVFMRHDANRSGAIEEPELRACLQESGFISDKDEFLKVRRIEAKCWLARSREDRRRL